MLRYCRVLRIFVPPPYIFDLVFPLRPGAEAPVLKIRQGSDSSNSYKNVKYELLQIFRAARVCPCYLEAAPCRTASSYCCSIADLDYCRLLSVAHYATLSSIRLLIFITKCGICMGRHGKVVFGLFDLRNISRTYVIRSNQTLLICWR